MKLHKGSSGVGRWMKKLNDAPEDDMADKTTALDRIELAKITARIEMGKYRKDDLEKLLGHIDACEELLKEADENDFFGTEGWRRTVGLEADVY